MAGVKRVHVNGVVLVTRQHPDQGSPGNRVRGAEVRQAANAGAADQHRLHDGRLGDHRSGHDLDFVQHAARCPEPPCGPAVNPSDQLVRAQRVRRCRRAARRKIGGAGARPERDGRQPTCNQLGVGQRPDPDRDVEVLRQQVDVAVVDAEGHPHLGVAGQELRQHRRQRPHGEGEPHADPQRAPRHADQPGQRSLGLADIVEDAPGMALQQAPGIGQPHVPRRALDQRRAGGRFQLRQRAAGGGLRHAKRAGGRR